MRVAGAALVYRYLPVKRKWVILVLCAVAVAVLVVVQRDGPSNVQLVIVQDEEDLSHAAVSPSRPSDVFRSTTSSSSSSSSSSSNSRHPARLPLPTSVPHQGRTLINQRAEHEPTSSLKTLLQHNPKSTSDVCNYYRTHKPLSWNHHGLVTNLTPAIEANCRELQKGSKREIKRVRGILNNWKNHMSDWRFLKKLQKCSYVRSIFSPDNFYTSNKERDFPLAYVFLFYDSPQQIVRLLKVIYRPHNIYCLHPDGKANRRIIEAFRNIATCLDNVFVPKELVKVTYQHFSMVDAQLQCFQQLSTTYNRWRWRYAMILCGKELPFSSNRIIVESLQSLRGASLIDVRHLAFGEYWERFNFFYWLDQRKGRIYRGGTRTNFLPRDVLLYKSSNYIGASRQFVEFLLRDEQVRDIRQFMFTALMPDEEFYATAYMLLAAPKGDKDGFKVGIARGAKKMYMSKTFFAVGSNPRPIKCTGRINHYSCLLSITDLKNLFALGSKSTYFFFNKYFVENDHVVMDCMEQRIVEQNRLEYERDCMPG